MTKKKERDYIDFAAFINIGLDRAMRHTRAAFVAGTLTGEGLSLQEWRSLLNLSRYGDCHLRELSRRAGLDATHTSRAITELEKRGYVRRYDDTEDSRRKRLCTTETGDDLVDRVWAQALGLDARIQQRLGKTRYRALVEALDMIREMTIEDLQGDVAVAAE
ncbi:MAG: MarR family winged helix-turn-helix transcriptional regulator [Pseudomonadota bacterium]